MRKIIFTVLAFVFTVGLAYSQVTTLWEKSAGSSSLPTWFSASGNTERGFGYGLVGANHRVFIPTRNGAVGGWCKS